MLAYLALIVCFCVKSMCLDLRVREKNSIFVLECQTTRRHIPIMNPVWYRNDIQVNKSMIGGAMLPGVEAINGSTVTFAMPGEPEHESRWACSINGNRSRERIYYYCKLEKFQ